MLWPVIDMPRRTALCQAAGGALSAHHKTSDSLQRARCAPICTRSGRSKWAPAPMKGLDGRHHRPSLCSLAESGTSCRSLCRDHSHGVLAGRLNALGGTSGASKGSELRFALSVEVVHVSRPAIALCTELWKRFIVFFRQGVQCKKHSRGKPFACSCAGVVQKSVHVRAELFVSPDKFEPNRDAIERLLHDLELWIAVQDVGRVGRADFCSWRGVRGISDTEAMASCGLGVLAWHGRADGLDVPAGLVVGVVLGY